jgi:hypothetical protein
LFSGENIAIFGGVEYKTPIDGLSLKMEYDPTDYTDVIGKEKEFREKGDTFILDSRFNFALNYKYPIGNRDNIDFSIGYVRGNTIYTNFSVHSNLNRAVRQKISLGPEKLKVSVVKDFDRLNQGWKKYVTDSIIWQLGNAGFVTHEIIFNNDEIIVELSQSRFQKTITFLDLASRIIANNAPQNIKYITIKNIDLGVETFSSTVERSILDSAVLKSKLSEDQIDLNVKREIYDHSSSIENEYLYPNFFWEIKPHLNTTIQHQERFFFWQLEALIHSEYSFNKGLYLMTDIGIDLKNNFDDYTYHIPDGELHHVRQDRRLYLTKGKTGLRKMALAYTRDITSNIKTKIEGGFLEWMYGGLGGEVLFIPEHKRWAFGADAYWVKQRDFDQKLSFREYSTVTGALSYYQEIPYYEMRAKISYGKFLGKDVGTWFELSRRFNSGARIGGFFALTDCDSQCVGEGSFHKGVYFELPMDLFYTKSSTRNKTGYGWAPLTKDAGAKLQVSSLYEIMKSAPDELDSQRLKSWSPSKILSGFGTKPKSLKL